MDSRHGQTVIRIASYLGFSPVATTASAYNTSPLESIGATHVVDRNADVAATLKDILPNTPIDVI